MTPERLAELRTLAAEMKRWEDEDLAHEQDCMSCRSGTYTPSDLDPTPLCDLCAQNNVGAVPELLGEVDRLITEVAARDRRIAELEEVLKNTRFYMAQTTLDRNVSPMLRAQWSTGTTNPTEDQVRAEHVKWLAADKATP